MTRMVKIMRFYRLRLKVRAVLIQELLAMLGIAVGVALLFASQVASTSLDSSISELTNSVIGPAKFQLEARDSNGFSERLLAEVRQTPGVRAAVPVLERRIEIIGSRGRENVDLIGVDPRSRASDGSSFGALQRTPARQPKCRRTPRIGGAHRRRRTARSCASPDRFWVGGKSRRGGTQTE